MSFDDSLLINKLVDFGLSIAVAQQMTNSINHSIQNTYTPPFLQNSHLSNANYFIAKDGKQAGPFSTNDMIQLIHNKLVNKDTLMWKYGMKGWDKAENIPDILKLVLLTPPPLNT